MPLLLEQTAGCAANPKFKDILITEIANWEIWGEVIYSIRPH
jgi:hypothetical protein